MGPQAVRLVARNYLSSALNVNSIMILVLSIARAAEHDLNAWTPKATASVRSHEGADRNDAKLKRVGEPIFYGQSIG